MSALHPTTQRRLQKIPQTNSLWEGDRRSFVGAIDEEGDDDGVERECIIWVDGGEGMVRAMDIVPADSGIEAVVRTLLRAIEYPHSYAKPSRPQKIVVKDRELQFFLRGALQELNIAVEYVPELPLIDSLFRGLEENSRARPPALPPQWEEPLCEAARAVWNAAPWEWLADNEILAVEVNCWEVETLYACVMGMLGQEFGILLYRSRESLEQFRQAAVEEDSIEVLEKAFVEQDCWFLNFELDEDEEEAPEPIFGSIHPYEGLRPFLGEEEASAVFVSLEAIARFVSEVKEESDPSETLRQSYAIALPSEAASGDEVSVAVATLPELAEQLLDLLPEDDEEDDEDEDVQEVPIREDLIPEDSFLSIGMMPWEAIAAIEQDPKKYVQEGEVTKEGEGMPIVLIQTSRPKAITLIESIQEAGGLEGIAFNPGEDPFSETVYDLGILRTGNGELYLFGEFDGEDEVHQRARMLWDRRSRQTGGYCGLIVARGLKGASSGQPQLKDLMALFEARALSLDDLGLGVLQLMPQFERE